MPIEDTPNFLKDNEQAKPGWIDEVVLEFRKGSRDILTYKQLEEQKMLAMTQTAVKAASSGYISGHVENYAFVDTSDIPAPTPEQKPQTPSEQILRHSSEWMRRSELDLAA